MLRNKDVFESREGYRYEIVDVNGPFVRIVDLLYKNNNSYLISKQELLNNYKKV